MRLIGLILSVTFLGFNVDAQIWSSACTGDDSIYSILEGHSARIVRQHYKDYLMTEKDSFWLNDSFVNQVTRDQLAVYNSDSVQGRDSIYNILSTYFLDTSMIGAPHIWNTLMHCEETDSFYQNLKESGISGDPYFDSLVIKYQINIRYVSFSRVSVSFKGLYNTQALRDSLKKVSWVLGVGAEAPIGTSKAVISFKSSGDTLYIGYQYGWGDCPAGCINYTYWNYRILPDCSVEFLGKDRYLIKNPGRVHVLREAKYVCQDSLVLSVNWNLLPPQHQSTAFHVVWSDNTTGDSIVVHDDGHYWVKLIPDTVNKFTLIDAVELEFLDTIPQLLLNDSTLCSGDSIWVRSSATNFPNFVFGPPDYFGNHWWKHEFLAYQPGMYYLIVDGCDFVDSVDLSMISSSTIVLEDSIYICPKDSITLSLSQGYDNYSWNNGGADYQQVVSNTGWYKCFYESEHCGFIDSTYLGNYEIEKVQLSADTSIRKGAVLLLKADGFQNYLWQDSSSNDSFVFNSSTYNYGTHIVHLTAEDSSGCGSTDSIAIRVTDGAQFKVLTTNNVTFYPNPSSGLIQITNLSDLKSIRIYNLFGSLLHEEKPVAGETEHSLNLSQLAKGTYRVVLETEEGMASEMVVLR